MSDEMKLNEVCPKCGKVHNKIEHLGILIEENDVKDIRLIINRIDIAKNAMKPDNIPDGSNKEKVHQLILVLTEALAEYQQDEYNWWQRMIGKYNLPKDVNVSLDSTFKEFVIIKT